MKRFIIGGCLIALVIGAIGAGVAGCFVYRAARPVLDDAGEYVRGLTALRALGEIDVDIASVEPYDPPASGELRPDQVDRFARVQSRLREALGARVDQIEATYRGLSHMQPDAGTESFASAVRALREVAQAVVEARRVQVDGLNREGFSQAEYEWVRTRVFQAAGHELAGGLDLGRVGRLAREGMGPVGLTIPDAQGRPVPSPTVPARNRELVRPLASQLHEWLPLAFFGL